jgi:hypothetical protein
MNPGELPYTMAAAAAAAAPAPEKHIFYHIHCNQNTYFIVKDQISKIVFSGLYEELNNIYCFITGAEDYGKRVINLIGRSGEKFKIAAVKYYDKSHEGFTLGKIKSFIKPGDKFLYIHTKGIGQQTQAVLCDSPVNDWRTYMEYFLIARHKECLVFLDTYDTVGVNYQHVPHNHYSGNFWWCTANYYLTLDDTVMKNNINHFAPEKFLCHSGGRVPNAKEFYKSGAIDHYVQPYPMSKYLSHST